MSCNLICPITLTYAGRFPFVVYPPNSSRGIAYNRKAFTEYLKNMDFRCPSTRVFISNDDVRNWDCNVYDQIYRRINKIYCRRLLELIKKSDVNILSNLSKEGILGFCSDLEGITLFTWLVHLFMQKKYKWRHLKRRMLAKSNDPDILRIVFEMIESIFQFAYLEYEYDGKQILPSTKFCSQL